MSDIHCKCTVCGHQWSLAGFPGKDMPPCPKCAEAPVRVGPDPRANTMRAVQAAIETLKTAMLLEGIETELLEVRVVVRSPFVADAFHEAMVRGVQVHPGARASIPPFDPRAVILNGVTFKIDVGHSMGQWTRPA